MNDKLPISLVVITFNEERNLERCLRAADFCSEIVVVDSGSTDRTLEIAAGHSARILQRAWTGYRDQKNYGTEAASQEWVLCIDADEVVSPELRQSIMNTFREIPACDAFFMNRHSFYADKLINHSGWYPQWRMFLYRKGKAHWGGDEPHTIVVFTGSKSARLVGDLYHYTYLDSQEHIRKSMRAAADAAEAMFKSGRHANVFDLVFRGPWAAIKCYLFQAGFRDGFYGFIIARMSGYYTFAKYAMLREKWRLHRRSASANHANET